MEKFFTTELGQGLFLVMNEENETNELQGLLGCDTCQSRRTPKVTSDTVYHGNNPRYTRQRLVQCDGRFNNGKNRRPCQEK